MAVINRTVRRARIKRSIRAKIVGTAARPRLSVYRSNKGMFVQIINDESGSTLVSASTQALSSKGTKKEVSAELGTLIASKAKEAGIDNVVFDRNGFLYHGRVKEMADAARKGGLKF